MRIDTKAKYLELAAAGLAGTRVRHWDTLEEVRADHYTGPLIVRSRSPNSPFMLPDVPNAEAEVRLSELLAAGATAQSLYWSARPPNHGRLLNAEVWDGPLGVYLHWSREQTNLRDALRTGSHAEGIAARLILRDSLWPDSLDELYDLWHRYPGAVIELTAFDCQMGDIMGRNCIIWEVRHY